MFATHRNGHCFQMNILVKQMPNLIEGIQYVGMIKPIISDFEFIMTDMDGVIDSFSKGMSGLLGLTPNLFKDKDTQINIQLLAPELIQFFLDTQKRGGKVAKSKYREAGGEPITLIVPKDFNLIAKSEAKSNSRAGGAGGGRKGNRSHQSNVRNRSQVFKQFLKCLSKPSKIERDKMPTAKMLMQQKEYTDCERKKDVMCEIIPIDIKSASNDSMRCLVFKVNKGDIPIEKRKNNNGSQRGDLMDETMGDIMMHTEGEGGPFNHEQKMMMRGQSGTGGRTQTANNDYHSPHSHRSSHKHHHESDEGSLDVMLHHQ